MHIRPAKTSDASRLAEIYAYYVENTAITFEYTAPSVSEFATRIQATLDAGFPYLVVEDDDAIQGYAYAGPLNTRPAYTHSAEITIYLDATAHRRGYGSALYESLQSSLWAAHITNLYACIADWPDGEHDHYLTGVSEQFHSHLGFTPVGRFHSCGYKFNRYYDIIWMEKII